MNYNCTVPTCYPAYRTSYDRMMQQKSCQFCQPSAMLQCKSGSPQVISLKERFTHKKQESDHSGKVIILSADSFCGYCKKLLKEIPQLKELLGNQGVDVEVVSDTDDKEKFQHVAKMAHAKGFPHAVVVDKHSNQIGEVSGYKPASLYAEEVLSKLSSTT